MIFLYRLLYLPGLLIALPYYIFRMWRRGGYRESFQHRFGCFHRMPPPAEGTMRIWLQAVSVGEVLAIGPLMHALQDDPRIEIVLTTTTSTGYAAARKRYSDVVARIGIFPLDFWFFSRTAWRRIQPDVIILTESELWPEHLHQAKKRSVPAFLVNARISNTSYRRYQKIPILAKRLLNKFQAVYAASDLDRSRLISLGYAKERIASTGSIKFDAITGERLSEEARLEWIRGLGFTGTSGSPFILLGASTWPGEESALLRAQKAALARGIDCRLVIAPRHAERGNEIAQLLEAQGLPWHQRSKEVPIPADLMIHLADTTGELTRLSQVADLAFVGKSLAPNTGGQTPIEAAGLGIPVLMGPHMNNFKDVSQSLVRMGAARFVSNGAELIDTVLELAQDKAARERMHTAGLEWHSNNCGSSQRIAESLLSKLS